MIKKPKYDVIIVGGGTAGVSCAWNAALRGLKTLIIEKNTYLGGAITSSLVIPAMKTSDNAINSDFFETLSEKLRQMGGAITYCDGNKGWFNPELTKIALDFIMNEVGVEVLYETCVTNINFKNKQILSVCIDSIDANNSEVVNKGLFAPIETKYIVDATGDAKIFQKLNCKFLNDKNKQPKSLRFIMSGIDVNKFSNWIMDLDADRNVTTSCNIEDKVYLSTAYTWDSNVEWALKPVFERAIAAGDLLQEDSNYFQLFSVAGTPDSIAFNAPRLLCNEGYAEARFRIFRLSNFCKKYLPGFENAYISSTAHSMGVRVSHRIEGRYIYSYEDLIEGKSFENPVVVSNYPVDIHSEKKNSSILEKVYKEYQLPLESLMSCEFDNLYAIGRSISADFKSQAALRIIPSCFSMGEGLAKYLAKS